MRLMRHHRSVIVFWTITALLAVVSGRLVGRAVTNTGASRWGPVRRVAVVTTHISPGDPLLASDLELREIPQSFAPHKPVLTLAEATGRTVRRELTPGAPIDGDDLVPGLVSGLAAKTGPRRRTMIVATTDGALRLSAGDRVDVLASLDGSGATEVVVRDAEVLGRTDRAVTVAVPIADAPVLAQALTSRSVTLALRGG